jgi:hypothetical protein
LIVLEDISEETAVPSDTTYQETINCESKNQCLAGFLSLYTKYEEEPL